MRNERLLILKMIEEGKITAAEGLALLEALEEEGPWPEGSGPEVRPGSDDEARSSTGSREEEPVQAGAGAGAAHGTDDPGRATEFDRRPGAGSWWEEPPREGRRPPEQEEGSGFRFDASRMGEQVLRAVDQLGERLQELFESGSNWFNDWLGASHEFPGAESGEVPVGEPFHVEVRLPNGKVMVEPSPDERYHAEWVAHVRGADRERAAERARQAVIVERDGRRLVLRGADNWWSFTGRVDVVLRLPSRGRYRLEFTLGNASLHLSDLRVERLRARLANGAATIERVRLGEFDLKAANGRIRMDGCLARYGRLGTANGRVEYTGAARRVRLSTSNGQVRARLAALGSDQAMDLPAGGEMEEGSAGEGILAETVNGQVRIQLDEELAARALVQLRSLHGSLTADLPGLNVWHREQAPARNRLEAAGPRAGSDPFSVEARSQAGSVRVESWGAGEPWD